MIKMNKIYKKIYLVFLMISICILVTPVIGAREPDPFFTINIMLPTNNLERVQYSEAIASELAKIGIGVNLERITWAEIIPHVFAGEMPPHAEGGYDVTFFAVDISSSKSHPGGYLKFQYDTFPPEGGNVMYWSSDQEDQMNYGADESKSLIDSIMSNLNLTETKEELFEWQKLWYDVMPNCMIYIQNEAFAFSTGLYGFDPLNSPLNSLETQWMDSSYPGTNDTVVYAAETPSYNFNALLSFGDYKSTDYPVALPPLDSLVGNTPSSDLFLPSDVPGFREEWMVENFNTTEFLKLYPRIATGMGNYSEDGLEYNITVRNDVLWHDGHQLDAWDVAFSFQAHFYFGNIERVVEIFNFDIAPIIIEDKDMDGFFEHISFQFNQKHAPFETDLLGLPLFPEHILGDPENHGFDNGSFDFNNWIAPPNSWAAHSFNTGNPAHSGGLNGPIGCGPVVFKHINRMTNEINYQKFENIQWDNISKTWVTTTNNSHFLVKDGKLTSMPAKVKLSVIGNLEDTLEEMKSGAINILDPLFIDVFEEDTADIAEILAELQSESSIKTILSEGTIWQAMYFNPKLEEGGIRHLNQKGVRHAISHMIPRSEIIENLLNGLGTPAYNPLLRTSWASIPEEDMLEYKKTVRASDGTQPEINATTAYDEYSIELALRWLKTEGYNTKRWEVFHGLAKADSISFASPLIVLLAVGLVTIRIKKK
ncbi:MAG: ABC transporter substrate-binding protein [Candidatus Hodarchaeales archaeon]